MLKKNVKKLLALGLAAGMVLGMTACGGEKAAEDTTAAQTEAAEDGKKVMNIGSMGYFAAETMDPANGWDAWYMMYDGTTETLFKLDENITPTENLAVSCESDDYINWTVTLRDDVTFQNGEKMTAEAVKKCFERTYEINDRAKGQIAIDTLEADGQKLIFHLQHESVNLLNDLCDPLWSVYDSENSNYTDTLYCTGPYIIREFEPYVETVVEKYEGYWGGEPKLDEVHLITISDTEAITMALQNGEIDMGVAMATSTVPVFENDENFVVDAVTTTRANRLYYNMDRELMSDPVIRQAIEMCLDRDGIAAGIYNNMATPCWAIYPDMLPYGGTEGLTLSVDKYDPEGAAALLAADGWKDSDGDGILDKDGKALELKGITFASRKELGQVLELLQSELAAIGVKLNVEVLESTNDVVLGVQLSAHQHGISFAEIGRAVRMFYRKTCLRNLILIPSGHGTQIAQGFPVLLVQHRQGERLACVYELLCVALGTQHNVGHIFAPHDAQAAPGSGHGVHLTLLLSGDQQPLSADHMKYIFL